MMISSCCGEEANVECYPSGKYFQSHYICSKCKKECVIRDVIEKDDKK